MKRSILILTSVLIAAALNAQVIDTKQSKVTFEIGNMKVRTVEGSFTGMSGTIQFDPSKLKEASFVVCIDPSTVNTNILKRDNHLRSADFFDVEKYPEICFTSGSISKTKSGYLVAGTMNIHGVSKKVKIPFTFKDNTFNGTLKINRFDYKLGMDSPTAMISEEATVNITCVVK